MLLLITCATLYVARPCLSLLLNNGAIIVKQGDSAIFEWNLTPKPDRYNNVVVNSNNSTAIFVLSYNDILITKSYRSRVLFSGDFNEGLIKFTLRDIKPTDCGFFTAIYAGHTYKRQELVILSKPDVPVVQVINRVVELEDLVLNCSTQSKSVQSGNALVMEYRWFIDGSIDFTNQTRFQKEKSTFKIQKITRKDSGKVITCKAFEREDEISNMSEPLALDVNYAPSNLSINPNNLKYRLPEGKSLQDITCNSDCNPACSFQWVKYQNDLLDQYTKKPGNILLLKNVLSSDSGIYMCNASNEFGAQYSEEIQIVVSNEPGRPEISELDPPLEGRDLKLMCDTNASSFYNVDHIFWNTSRQQGQQNNRYEKHGNIFKLKNVGIIDSGTTITCQVSASAVMSLISSSYLVVTLFAPRDIKLSTNLTIFNVKQKDVIPDIHCESQCSPLCQFNWYRDVITKVSNENVLSLGQLELGKAGKYYCIAWNAHGTRGSKTIQIDIYDIYLQKKFTCMEEKSINITCNVVTNKRDILFLPWLQSVNNTILKSTVGFIENRRNILQIRNCSMEHIGKYSCRIPVNENENNNATTDLFVLGKPKITSHLAKTSRDKTSASLVVYFYSMPHPKNVTWFRNSTILSDSENFRLHLDHGMVEKTIYNKTVYYEGFHAQMKISNLTREYYGLYILEIANQYGKVRKQIHLNPTETEFIPLIWFILVGSNFGTFFIIILIAICVFRRHRRKMRHLKIKETLDRIRQRLETVENEDLRFGELNETEFSEMYHGDQYQIAENEYLEVQSINEEYITQEVTRSSYSFIYDYPEEIFTVPPRIIEHGSYEDIKSDTNPNIYDKIEEYDDTAVPTLRQNQLPTDITPSKNDPSTDVPRPLIHLTKDGALVLTSTDKKELTNHSSTEESTPADTPLSTNRTSTETTKSINQESRNSDSNESTNNMPTEKPIQVTTCSTGTATSTVSDSNESTNNMPTEKPIQVTTCSTGTATSTVSDSNESTNNSPTEKPIQVTTCSTGTATSTVSDSNESTNNSPTEKPIQVTTCSTGTATSTVLPSLNSDYEDEENTTADPQILTQ